MAEPGIVILMDHALSMSMGVAPTKPPKLPSDIGKNFSASSHSTTDSERFLRVAAIWAESVDPLEWPSLIPQVLRKVYSFPETAVYVKFVGKLAQYWETNKAAIAGLSTLAEIMGNQPTIADYSDVGDDDLRNLLLCRLSPLLMLKMMPLKTLAQMQTSVKLLPNSIVEATELTDPSDYIVPELINRIENSNEFDQVRKLACEVLGRLATSISPIIVQGLGQSLQNRNYDNARSYIYSCCCFIAAHGPDSAQSLSEWFLPVLDLFLLSLDGEPKLEAVLRGFLDLCSLCLAISARTGALAGTAKTKPLIETIPMEGPSDVPQPPHNTSKTNLEQFVLLVLSLLDPASEDWAATKLIFPAENNQRKYSVVEKRYAISTSMANILTMTVRRMTESMKDASVPSEEQSIFRKSLSWIGEIFGARLAFVVNKCCMDQSKDSAIPTAACLQALFNLMYELKEESSDVLDCIDISLKALLHGEAAVCSKYC
ncbi:hypothetical protein DFJ73DRAFT_229315 [Zopfochytrium polystomum]|nr:hypothetical protein DFJ73DRAFT_229315 [Zopfochytrium polystomum]